MLPLTVVGQYLASPEGVALIVSAAGWLIHRFAGRSRRARVIALKAGVVFDGMEAWAAYRRSKGEPVTGAQKLDAYLGYIEAAIKSMGETGGLTNGERVGLAADAAVRAWLAKAPAKSSVRAPAKVSAVSPGVEPAR